MTGVIVTYAVADGDTVSAGDIVCVLEAMKMENHVVAHRDGTVGGIGLSDGDAVEQGALLATITA
jgi:acetyl-CoA/propionyl-CoA carboxylase biotin carboxyl carrier protein